MIRKLKPIRIIACTSIISFTTSGFTPNSEKENRSIFFCNEVVPLQQPQVFRYYNKALQDVEALSWYSLKNRATPIFNTIVPLLRKYNIPEDFKYIPVIESGMIANATSHKGAHGYWQFMPVTAREMGLIVNDHIDERSHLTKSTIAACKYFKQLYDVLGSWTLVAAAYNAGPTKVAAYMNKAQSMSYYDFKGGHSETMNYLYRVLAVKYIFTRPNYVNAEAILKANRTDDNVIVGIPTSSKIVIRSPKTEQETKPANLVVRLDKANLLATQMVDIGAVQKGEFWTFKVLSGMRVDNQALEVGDRIYAQVSDFNNKLHRVSFNANKVYAIRRHQIFTVNLTATDIEQAGIALPVSNGQIVYWKK